MDKQDIATLFYKLIAPSLPNEWEIEDIFDELASLPDESCTQLLNQIPAVWPVSHSLCFGYLKYGVEQIQSMPPDLLPEWVRQLLFSYEKGGLRDAETFMSDTETNFLSKYQSVSEVSFSEISGSLTLYIRGVSGRSLSLREDAQVWTDTDTIFLPPEINICSTREENRLLYKFLLTYQSTLVQLRVFEMSADEDCPNWVSDIVSDSGNSGVLFRVFLLIQGVRYIRYNLPGLWNRCATLIRSQFEPEKDGGVNRILCMYWDLIETGSASGNSNSGAWSASLDEYKDFWEQYRTVELQPLSQSQQYILGVLNFTKAGAVIAQRREKDKNVFVRMLANILAPHVKEPEQGTDQAIGGNSGRAETDGAVAVISASLEKVLKDKKQYMLQLDNSNVVVPDELVALAQSIFKDLGSIPVNYVQAASGLAGGGITGDGQPGANDDTVKSGTDNGHVYDEWDCRRNGYRHDWCTVLDEELPAVKSDFIARTLYKHNGLRKRLRMQFEMMRNSHRYVRRQRDGDDLDLDAIIDAMGDAQAGTAVGDRLFVRLERDKRDISTLFLIDMSNSTSGWIGTFIKEALVLLCEAMEKVGDRYGIYGFSGMRRSRCKLYHIKTIDELYDDSVRERISAIGPKDYTRMAPAIRHLTSILERSDTRTRLLITLSDGKPEDYDGYHGEYAIEDTKKALLEAQGKGVKPFCITVDKQRHDYLDHMFGSGNYIFINKIENLPAKMSQIYRILTG